MVTQPLPHIVCAYGGVPGDCSECGGHDDTGTGLCSTVCRQARADREAGHAAADAARRAAEDAYGAEVTRLHDLGHTYEQIDQLLKEWP